MTRRSDAGVLADLDASAAATDTHVTSERREEVVGPACQRASSQRFDVRDQSRTLRQRWSGSRSVHFCTICAASLVLCRKDSLPVKMSERGTHPIA